MAENVTLNPVGNLQDTTTAQTVLNANNALIEAAFEDVLSRGGTSPNQMLSNLDMNSNQIINLPAPASVNSPARLQDIISASTALTVPPVGTSGGVVGLLNANKTDSGNNTFTGINTFSNTSNSFTGSFTGLLSSTSILYNGGVLRYPLNATGEFFVSATTGNDSNTGTISAPFKTITAGVNYIQKSIDFAGNSVVLNVAAGTYIEQVSVTSPWGGGTVIQIVGAGSASTIVQAPNGLYCFFCKDYGAAQVSGFTFNGSGASAGAVNVAQFGICDLGPDIVFGAFPGGVHISVDEMGSAGISGAYTIAGSAAGHLSAVSGGQIIMGGNPVATITATGLAFTNFASILYGGRLLLGGWSATGAGVSSVTGTRFFCFGSSVQAGGVDLNTLFPGNASGAYNIVGGWDSNVPGTLSLVTISSPSIVSASLTSASFSNPPTTPTYTVTTLNALSSPVAGMIAIVGDATNSTFGSTVTGGGSTAVPVYFGGGSWRIG